MPADEAASRLRVVLDSNVLISALAFPGGPPHQILQLVARGDLVAAVSPHILAEVEDVLRGKLAVPEPTIRDSLAFLREHCSLVDPPAEAAVSTLTPADNRVLDCALAARTDYLVTGDRGIQQIGELQGIMVVSPRDFLTLLGRPAW